MESHFTAIFLSVLLSLGTTSAARSAARSADFQKGYVGYKSGDYATALRESTHLAKQGLANAQFNLGQMYHYGEGVPKND